MFAKQIKWVLAGGLLALTFGVLPCRAQDGGGDEGARRQPPRRGMERRFRRDQNGPGRGERMRAMRRRMLENLPGAKEEIERHRKAMEAIREKIKSLGQELKESIRNAGDKDAKQEVLEGAKEKLKQLAGEIVDENLNHAQKMLDLRKANREQAVEQVTKMLMRAAARRHRGGMRGPDGRRPRGKNEGMRRRFAPPEHRQPRGENGPVGGPAPRMAPSTPPEGAEGNVTEKDLATALEEALK